MISLFLHCLCTALPSNVSTDVVYCFTRRFGSINTKVNWNRNTFFIHSAFYGRFFYLLEYLFILDFGSFNPPYADNASPDRIEAQISKQFTVSSSIFCWGLLLHYIFAQEIVVCSYINVNFKLRFVTNPLLSWDSVLIRYISL